MDAGTDTSTPFKSPGIFCGTADPGGTDVYCAPATKECCATQTGPQASDKSYACVSNNGGGGLGQCQGAPIKCDDRTDCPSGQVCCGAFDQAQGYEEVVCQTNCDNSPIPGLAPVRFCDGNAPIDECKEIGKTCTASGSLPGFHFCK